MRKRVQEWPRWLTNCRRDGDCWQGRAFIPSWGATLNLRILTDKEASRLRRRFAGSTITGVQIQSLQGLRRGSRRTA